MNAYAVELEEEVLDLSAMIGQMAPLVKQAYDLKALWTPEGFPALSELFINQMATIPGAYDHYLTKGGAELSHLMAEPYRELARQQQAQAYEEQHQAEVPIAQAVHQVQSGGFDWGAGGDPSSREVGAQSFRPQFPDMPNPSGQSQSVGQIDLSGTHPSQLWGAIDAVSANGGFRNTTLVRE